MTRRALPTVRFLLALGLCTGLPLAASAQSPAAPEPEVRTRAGVAPPASSASATELAKKLQNPIGDLYSFPFQSNTNFRVGPNNGTQEILNIQPVIPIHVNEDWNIITRTILPLVWNPSFQPFADTVPFGSGPITFSAFLSPSKPVNGWLWAVGPVLQIPTASDRSLGSPVWGGGPTAALVYMGGPWVAGALANNVWSFGGTSGRGGTQYNNFLLQPFVNYNFGEGWYVGTAPIITANWLERGSNAWTVPVGAQVGRVIRLGRLPVNLLAGAYYNVVRPDDAATWQLRTQVTLIF
ncbi:hypothetical protein [Roseomonas fluvialis]|uniref:Neuromedin U n=1 Tax=Roseomonas fluvialis TaxID=1750527 RepID=A0ABM7XY74_9PROT|nr:hypothetical protein [Roseomonas fluvialis]BDG70447.1 hypothetical protein Rmf_03760 [Roseomonas fluvialis]